MKYEYETNFLNNRTVLFSEQQNHFIFWTTEPFYFSILLSDEEMRLEWISGFSGSNGQAAVTLTEGKDS